MTTTSEPVSKALAQRLGDPDVADGLGCFAALPEWLADPMRADRVAEELRSGIPELTTGRVTLNGVRPERLRIKDRGWLARYRLAITDATGHDRDVVLVGELTPDGTPPGAMAAAAPFGEPGWRGWLPGLRLSLTAQAADPALPALPEVTDPSGAAVLLEAVLRRAGRAQARITGCAPKVVRYKPGSRCTVVCSLTYATPGDPELPGTVVLKVHQGDKGRHADAAMRALWDTELRRGTVLRIAEPLGYLPDERVLIQGPVPEEQTLKALARKAFASGDADVVDELRHYLDVTADALLALHGCGAVLERSASWTGELGQIRGVLARLAGAVPALPGGAAPLLDRLTDIDRRVATDAMVPAHHDFRPAQVLLEGSRLPRVGFIDFDGASMAEPALDLGRFCAKLRDIAITAWSSAGVPVPADVGADRLALLDDLCRGFVDRYRLRAPVTPDRVLLWECTDLLTALLHAWTKVRIARVTPRLFLLQHRLTTAAAS